MLLRELAEYSQRAASQAPKLYAEGPLRYVIELGSDGQYNGLITLGGPSTPRTRRGTPHLLPQVQRSSGIRPLLLADKPDYTLGLSPNEKQATRTQRCHTAYVELAKRCATETEEPDVLAVLRFLQNQPLEHLDLGDDFDNAGIITFRVEGRYVIDNPAVQRFWANNNEPNSSIMQCLVCREDRPVLERLQSKIKGIPGGQSTGTSIISANSDAFESYGLQASQIAPTCQECAEDFTRGLNALLSSESNRLRISNGAFVFWTRQAQIFDSITMMSSPEPQHVQEMLESVRHGRRTELDENDFYALSLSAAGGRAVVRDWLVTTVGSVKGNLVLWFERQQVAPTLDGENKFYGVFALACTTVRHPKDLPVTTIKSLVKCALSGEPIPRAILKQVIRRCQIERRVTRPQAALIKSTLLSGKLSHRQENDMTELDVTRDEPGYLLGRLLLTLGHLQYQALGNVNNPVQDKYFSSLSTRPKRILPTLRRNAQNHLSALRRKNGGGAAHAIEGEIHEIWGKLENVPKILSVEQQAEFCLGYAAQDWHNRREGIRLKRQPNTA